MCVQQFPVDNEFDKYAMSARDPEVSRVDKNKPQLYAEVTAVDTAWNSGV